MPRRRAKILVIACHAPLLFSLNVAAQDVAKYPVEAPVKKLVADDDPWPAQPPIATQIQQTATAPFTAKGEVESPLEDIFKGVPGIEQPQGILPQPLIDFGMKSDIEMPTKHVIGNAPEVDFSKRRVERPVETLITPSTARTSVPEARPATFESEIVKPGQVNWHRDFSAACAQAKVSGKPVLHFQLMGELDQRFT